MTTIHELVQGARDRFVTAGISAGLATLDAEVLARQVLGWDRARFLADRNERASTVFLLNYEPLVARRERSTQLDRAVKFGDPVRKCGGREFV